VTTAAERWPAELAAWAIDPAIRAAAPEDPYAFTPALFRADHDPDTVPGPLLRRAHESLLEGGTVLDVGAGAGAASLPLAPPASRVVAVDTAPAMLDELERSAAERGVAVTRVDGSWPESAPDVPVCDVAVCSHVFYNVPDLGPFARALTERASRRVVVELHTEHPWVPLGPLWEHFHHQPRPAGPTAALAVDVLREHGIDPHVEEWSRPLPEVTDELARLHVAAMRRRLCLPVDRESEVAALMARQGPQERRSAVLWWDG
jgi:SAM-dependent methyltransferase